MIDITTIPGIYLILTALFIILASVGHLLLKIAANDVAKNGGKMYFHPVSIVGYALFAIATLSSIYALKGLSLSFFFILTSLTYICIPIMAVVLLRETTTRNKVIGIIVITIGVIIFSL